MTSNAAFLMQPRGLFEHQMFKGKFDRRSAFMWLVGEAVRDQTAVAIGGIGVELSRGQLCHSLRYMATTWGWDETSVRRFLSALKKAGLAAASPAATVAASPAARQTIVTICNFDRFQGGGSAGAASAAAPSAGRTPRNNKKGNKKEESVSCETGSDAPPTPREPIKHLWDRGLTILGGDTRNHRSLLGKLRQRHGDDALQTAIDRCEQVCPSDPLSYLVKACEDAAKVVPLPRRTGGAGVFSRNERILAGVRHADGLPLYPHLAAKYGLVAGGGP